MNKKISVRWITRTAVMLALLICLQALGSRIPDPMVKQLITGTCVNAVLTVTVLTVGLGSGLTIALISPVFAFVLQIAPQIITVIPIMLGNSSYVALLYLLLGKSLKPVWKQPVALVTAAAAKFLILYTLVVKVICGVAVGSFLGKKLGENVLLAPPMLKMLPTMFAWPQLVTALVGGSLALLIVPTLRRALKK
jgi:hypothetical protein